MASKKKLTPQPPTIIEKTVFDYIPDDHNANLGTPRGLAMLEDSLSQDGAGRSIVADKNGKIPAGNKTLEAAVNAGIERVIEIETEGDAIIVHKRRDWDLDDPTGSARRYATRDNQASAVSLVWDANEILKYQEAGADLGMFQEWELNKILGTMPPDIDRNGMWQGMPEYEMNDIKPFHSIKVHFKSDSDMVAFAKLVGQTVTNVTTHIFYPKPEKPNRRINQVIDEPIESDE